MKSQIFLHILIVPIMYEREKLKKVIGNKILFQFILEQYEKSKQKVVQLFLVFLLILLNADKG